MQTIEHVGQAQPAPRLPGMDTASTAVRETLGAPAERAARPSQPDRQQPALGTTQAGTTAHKPVSYGAGF
jgi:hypothetical protein